MNIEYAQKTKKIKVYSVINRQISSSFLYVLTLLENLPASGRVFSFSLGESQLFRLFIDSNFACPLLVSTASNVVGPVGCVYLVERQDRYILEATDCNRSDF